VGGGAGMEQELSLEERMEPSKYGAGKGMEQELSLEERMELPKYGAGKGMEQALSLEERMELSKYGAGRGDGAGTVTRGEDGAVKIWSRKGGWSRHCH